MHACARCFAMVQPLMPHPRPLLCRLSGCQARDFLIAIAEPISRPDMLHEYRVNKDALMQWLHVDKISSRDNFTIYKFQH